MQVSMPVKITDDLYKKTVDILPAYARGFAADLRGDPERASQFNEPPPYMDDLLGPLRSQGSPTNRSGAVQSPDALLHNVLKVMGHSISSSLKMELSILPQCSHMQKRQPLTFLVKILMRC